LSQLLSFQRRADPQYAINIGLVEGLVASSGKALTNIM